MKNTEAKKEKFSIDYLGYKIVNTWNTDGYVLVVNGCSEGNLNTLEQAKEFALMYLLADEKRFNKCIIHRLIGHGGTYLEFLSLQAFLKERNIPMPEEITSIDGENMAIGFNGKPIGNWISK